MITPDNAEIEVFWRLFGVRAGKASFRDFSGSLVFDPAQPEKAELSISILSASLESGDSARDSMMRGEDFFDAERYPEASFQSTGFERIDDQTGVLRGLMILRGVTQPLSLDVRLASKNDGNGPVRFRAKGEIARTDFGMTRYRPFLGRRVDIRIDLRIELP